MRTHSDSLLIFSLSLQQSISVAYEGTGGVTSSGIDFSNDDRKQLSVANPRADPALEMVPADDKSGVSKWVFGRIAMEKEQKF